MRCQTSSTSSSARAVVARLSGLLPDRPKDTISVGVWRSRKSRGPATMLVVAMASTRRFRWRRRAGAAISPTNAELPAPVRMIRRSGRLVIPRRNPVVSSSLRAAISRQAPGCCPISRRVAPPFSWAAAAALKGTRELVIGCSSGQTGSGVGAHRVAYSVDDQRLRDGFEVTGAYPDVLTGQKLVD